MLSRSLEKDLMQENATKILAKNFQLKTKYKDYPNLNTTEKLVVEIHLIEWFCKLHRYKL